MTLFSCWKPDNGVDPEDATMIDAYDAEMAAEAFAERTYADDDYPDEQTIMVADADGVVTVFEVFANMEPVFRAAVASPAEQARIAKMTEGA